MPSSSSGAIMAKREPRRLPRRQALCPPRQYIHKGQNRLRRHRAPPCDARVRAQSRRYRHRRSPGQSPRLRRSPGPRLRRSARLPRRSQPSRSEKARVRAGAIERAECRRDELITRMLVTAQHDQRLGATVVSDQSSAPASHVPIRNKACRHTKPIIDHLSHNPSVRIGGINR